MTLHRRRYDVPCRYDVIYVHVHTTLLSCYVFAFDMCASSHKIHCAFYSSFTLYDFIIHFAHAHNKVTKSVTLCYFIHLIGRMHFFHMSNSKAVS